MCEEKIKTYCSDELKKSLDSKIKGAGLDDTYQSK